MRRFSSEGSLLDLDMARWNKPSPRNPEHGNRQKSVTNTPHLENDELDAGSAGLIPTIQEPSQTARDVRRKELVKEHSVSVENLSDLAKQEMNHLKVGMINESCRAYSDSQLASVTEDVSESVERDGQQHMSLSVSTNPLSLKSQERHQHRAKLSAAKLHIKSLFGQTPHSSNPNLFNAEEKNSARERRSRLHFMRQWSQVGHNKKGRISRDMLESWAESLNALLESPVGVSVFGAFLRSEFSEENLQFYLACEQYRHSSNNFSLQRRAKDICATYIQPGAPREVNLDSKTRELTLQLLQAPSHTSLLSAQKRVYSLLDTDCYPRFLQSNVYLTLLNEVEASQN
ncbi:regulator of G-protein signaling 1 [Fundulus heteroclitus]|uniref:regulator of G-protein signaling 1 n=1 Tax=Fundulus heteroclitus TaxID=8078 RepID=UPI00165C8493|nr:regulator of G-protein signaling 1 [Fundulus heteroclitus]XP_021166890.2 regulator of G-protein signaling 1 [Fundulus heteroclitus]XP_021166892.2 regulator of G-protein signaling 1 [Fundulus heteroclitus]XP_021166893.2 regulator of G-protein signaling 1 [Fundulus heteroclitus]XP_036001542.1 regulator of G-protein signaling 1 [Fundulus heteroclitus]